MKNMFSMVRVAFLAAALAIVAGAGVFDWEKAVSLYKQGQYREAIEEFKKVLSEYPDHSDSWKFVGLAWYQLKEYSEATAPLEKALELKRKEGRNDPDIIRALGQAHLTLKAYEKSLPYLETLARVQMNVPANFYMLGVAYANLNRPEEAITSFEKAVKLDPADADSWYYLGVQYFRNGKIDKSVTALRGGLKSQPKNADMLGLLTEVLLRQGADTQEPKKASAIFDEAIRTGLALKAVRDNAETNELLGRAYLAVDKYTNAEMALARALETSKDPSAALYFNLGFAHAQNKSWARAAEMLARADRMNPGDLNTLYYLGYVYENLRRYPEALEAYSRAYEASGRSNADLKASIERVTPLAKP
ncbi:MAG: tetratricopeptide repeat protein [Acidobacteriota bacterium]|nr:MAG: tetratricopeptide repeat protein [Acidobacteriota bacterium]